MSQDLKLCPTCGKEILSVARKCRYCGSYLDPSAKPPDDPPERRDSMDLLLSPEGRPPSAIAAGYLGLFSFFPFLGAVAGPLGVIFGRRALKVINKDPSLAGKGRAWFGIIAGGLLGLIQILILVGVLIAALIKGLSQ
jgi:hypothetical protein